MIDMAPVTDTSSTTKRRIVIVDHRPIVRIGIQKLIEIQKDLEMSGEAEDEATANKVIAESIPHLVVMDIYIKNGHGFDFIKTLRIQNPELLVLVISLHDEVHYAERAIRSGAHGYIMMEEPAAQILEAIRHVLDGEVYLSPRMSKQLLRNVLVGRLAPDLLPTSQLSERELEVLDLLGSGQSTRQIAGSLNVGIKTVETHRARLKKKLGLKDGVELVRYATLRMNRKD